MTHTFLGETIDFNMIHKKRKSLGIYIDVYGHIEVRVPMDIKDERVLHFIEEKWSWIQEKTKEMKEKTAGYQEKTFKSGERFMYLGNMVPIGIVEDPNVSAEQVFFNGQELIVTVKSIDIDKIKQMMKRFYHRECKLLVEARMKVYQPSFRTKPKSIRISDNKSTWGTCDSKFQMTFNWKLAMAPIEVIDYIVVHEMCHMVHLNHDRSFWRLVGKLVPDYEEHQKYLASSGWKMVL